MSARTRKSGRMVAVLAVLAACLSCSGAQHGTRTASKNLPKPISQMTAGELWDFTDDIGFDHGPYQERDCAHGTCRGRFDAAAGIVPGPGNVTTNGTIVARIVNAGGGVFGGSRGEEARYKATIRGGNLRYYVVAISNGAGDWSWSVREAIRNGSAIARETASGSWTTCPLDTTNPDHPRHKSEFAKCPHGANDDNNGSGEPMPRALYSRLDPGWVTCTAGCCTAGE